MKLALPPTSITLRLAVLYALSASLALVLVGLLITHSVERHFEDDDLAELSGKLHLVRHNLDHISQPEQLHQLDNALIGHHGLSIAIIDADGKIIYASEEASFLTPFLAPLLAASTARTTSPQSREWEYQGRNFRGLFAEAPTGLALRPVTIAVARDIKHHQDFMASFSRHLAVAILLGVLITGTLGYFAARRGLRPLHEMAAATQSISAERLDRRIAPETLPDELRNLAVSFNAMLGRLETSFTRLNEFSSDLAHELRTPVNTLMMQTQVALSQPRPAAAYREVLYSSLEEYERLARMISDMLLLAKADQGLAVLRRERIALADEAHELAEFYEALAAEAGVNIAIAGNASLQGDRLMLRRALANLLGNAIRHTPRGATIQIGIATEAQSGNTPAMVSLQVSNPGPTIDAGHLERLFDRFYRADPSRTHRDGEGSGLGLAITHALITAHGGQISVQSAAQQTTFVIRLPAEKPD